MALSASVETGRHLPALSGGSRPRDGGFPPLLVEPIDFYRLYRDRMAEAAGDGADAGDDED